MSAHLDHPDARALLADAEAAPWRHGLFTLLRALAARHPEHAAIGRARRPDDEAFRLGQHASLAFAPRELASVRLEHGQAQLKLFGLGMLGPNGPLPLHYTEMARERQESMRDSTLNDFLDIFHHRAFCHFYRAWAQAQAAAGLDRADEETFTPYIARLIGDEPGEAAADSGLAEHARWASAAHRVRQSRNPDGLVATLARHFGVRVQLEEYPLQWIAIEANEHCRLARPGPAATLGQGALLGEVAPDRQHSFRLLIGPLTLEQYLGLTPQQHTRGGAMAALVEWVRAFVGFEYAWEVELLIHADRVQAASLGGAARLGWSSWLEGRRAEHPISGMVFSPEAYLATPAQEPTP